MAVPWFRRSHGPWLTFGGMAFVVLVFTWMAWNRRWIADDGLIYVRVVRQILDGHGPTFNIMERAEANTSALWPWLVAALSVIFRADPCHAAVFGGIACTVTGVATAMLATRRWHLTRGTTAVLVPGSILIVLGMFPYWDYASSGLENGLSILWLACSWFVLVGMRGEPSTRAQYAAALTFGLGPLVRPDFALVSAVFMLATWLVLRPTRRRALGLFATAVALPFLFEIFRAGYYGVLVPLPALAKSASHAEWERGYIYLFDVVRTYWLVIPMPALAAIGLHAWRRFPDVKADRIIAGAPVIAALLLGGYVVRVGGDFMHARMLLSPLFLAVLPATLLPFTRPAAVPIGAVWLWAAVIGPYRNDHRNHSISRFDTDERVAYVKWIGEPNPIDSGPFIRKLEATRALVEDAARNHRRLMVTEATVTYPRAPGAGEPIVYIAGRLGVGGALVPLDGFVVDTLGLSNPLGARLPVTGAKNRPGHQKPIPFEWLFADFADPAADETLGDARKIRAARHAMTCGALAELLASVREPLTARRFWDNLIGSVRRTRLAVPADAIEAERVFCGNEASRLGD